MLNKYLDCRNLRPRHDTIFFRGHRKRSAVIKEQLQRELEAICAYRKEKLVQWLFNLSWASSKMAWAYPDLHQLESR